jgi:hypothetical protein
MLLQFAVSNFHSFKDEEVLNLAPAGGRIHADHILHGEGARRRVRALPLAVCYGANASGKSNLVTALDSVRTLVTRGTRTDAPTGVVPFRLDAEARAAGSRFELVIWHEGVLYTYGFVATNREIKEEWLFAVRDKREVRLFERVTEGGAARVVLGNQLAPTKDDRQRLQFVAAGTRPNQLFLTEANDRNVRELDPLMRWFKDRLTIIWPDAQYGPLVLRAHDDPKFAGFLAELLRAADTGIGGLEPCAEDLDSERHLAALPARLRRTLVEDLERSEARSVALGGQKTLLTVRHDADKPIQLLSLRTRHETGSGETVLFDPEDESDGTHRLMHLAPALFDSRGSDVVYVIDELDRSLHPQLCRFFIEAFLKHSVTGAERGQLIVTTHDTNLLDLDLLRRDEIWFVEKDRHGASHLTSLAEFKLVRADLRLDKGYLAGRFGAIPFLGDPGRLSARQGSR